MFCCPRMCLITEGSAHVRHGMCMLGRAFGILHTRRIVCEFLISHQVVEVVGHELGGSVAAVAVENPEQARQWAAGARWSQLQDRHLQNNRERRQHTRGRSADHTRRTHICKTTREVQCIPSIVQQD